MTANDRKIVVLGDSGAGKTSIIQRYVHNTFTDEYKPTFGAQPLKKTVEHDGHTIKLVIWDVAGHLFRLHPAYSADADGVILVCDMNRTESADVMLKWLSLIEDRLNSVPFVVAANKSDIAEFHPECRKKLPENLTIVITSAKTGSNIKELFLELFRKMA